MAKDEKNKLTRSRKNIMIRLFSYLAKHKTLLITAFVLMILSNVLALAGPALAGFAVDCITKETGVDFDGVWKYCILMISVYVLSAVLSYLLTVVMSTVSKKVTYAMRKDVFEHLSRLPVSYYDKNQTGDIISRISYDIDTINTSLSNDVLQIGASLITVVGSFVMMCTINVNLLVIFVITVPITIIFTRYKTKKVQPLFKKRSKSLGELNGYAEEMMSGLRTIKVYGNEKNVTKKFDIFNKEAVDAYYEADYHACAVGPSVNFINNLSLALVSLFGSVLYLFSRITLGDISSFILYSRKFSGPINESANIISELQSAFAAADRMFNLLDEEPEKEDIPDAIELMSPKGDVSIENLDFSYDKKKDIIKDFSIDIKAGQTVAIVGHTGAGKTTIINLLMRFYDPDKGSIRIDGVDIRDLTRKSLRQSFTMVLQDTWLFSGSVFENIAYGKEGATLDDVKRVAKDAKIDLFIENLPDGYDTVLSDDGQGISKGQKQLITIARAMLIDSHLLILDEATSNVDSRTEMQISDAMQNLMKGKTSFIIAHRLSTIMNADVIIVMGKGKILEVGKHDELLKNKGHYYEIYNSQFK
ncbi:MAG: ABC transporter ATP-binding protein [Ruminococcaceae bacterium]|nr:ABC transporter ATP-binding protein [Oscillospiraceae bacterium]